MGFLLQWLATTALELTIALVLALLGWKFVFGSLWARWLAPIFGEAASKSREQSKGWGLIRSLSIPGGMSSATELVPKGTSGSMFKGLAQVVRTQTVAEPCELSLKLLMQSSWSPEDLVQNKEALSMALKVRNRSVQPQNVVLARRGSQMQNVCQNFLHCGTLRALSSSARVSQPDVLPGTCSPSAV